MSGKEIINLVKEVLGYDVTVRQPKIQAYNDARLMAVLLMDKEGLTIPQIARIINRHYTGIYLAVDTAKGYLETDKEFQIKYNLCQDYLSQKEEAA